MGQRGRKSFCQASVNQAIIAIFLIGTNVMRSSIKNYAWNLIIVVSVLAILLFPVEFFAGILRDAYYQPDAHPIFAKLLNKNLPLDDYEVPSDQYIGHWHLKQGFQSNNPGGGNTIKINADGFRGDEINSALPKDGRLIIVGDSVMFGTGTYALPGALQFGLSFCEIDADVINAGVEGYSTRNVWAALGTYFSVTPTMAVIYIGWNDIFSEKPLSDSSALFGDTVWLFEKANRGLITMSGMQEKRAIELRYRKHILEFQDPMRKELLRSIKGITTRIADIVRAFRARGIEVTLVTLMGLIDEKNIEYPAVQKIAHLPFYTQNPYVLVDAKRIFNERIIKMASKLGVGLIDLDDWVSREMQSKMMYFTDSVHLNDIGLRKVGYHVAESLAKTVWGRQCTISARDIEKH